jgi:pimeloyl-ACP methyl ester carboxylesterase
MKTSPLKLALKKTIRSFLFIAYRAVFSIGSLFTPRLAAEKGTRLFSTPTRPRRSRLVPETMVPPPRTRTLPLPGGEVCVYQWGDPVSEPTVLLLHGWSGWGLQFAAFVPALLEKGVAVIAVDHVAHGRSEGRQSSLPVFIRTTRELLAAFPTVKGIVAHSLGAAAAAFVLAGSGARDTRAVMLAPPRHPRVFLDQFGAMLGMSRRVVDEMQRRIEETNNLPFAEVDVEAVAPRIKAPVLLIHDPADEVVPFSHGERYAQLVENARFVAMNGIGHYKMLDSPEIVSMAIDFLFPEFARTGERPDESVSLRLVVGKRETASA